jgi:hypothetical protein
VESQIATTFCCLKPKQASLLVGGFYVVRMTWFTNRFIVMYSTIHSGGYR